MQGFRKSDPDLWQFSNDHFIRGRKDLLTEIQRKKTTAAGKEAAAPGTAAIEVGLFQLSHAWQSQVILSLPAQPGESTMALLLFEVCSREVLLGIVVAVSASSTVKSSLAGPMSFPRWYGRWYGLWPC